MDAAVGFVLEVTKMLYEKGAFENDPTPNQSRSSICGTLMTPLLHCYN